VSSHKLRWDSGSVELDVFDDASTIDIVVRRGQQLLVVRDAHAPRPAPGTLDVRSEGLWLSIVDEGDDRWTINLEAFALEVEHPDDERGTLVPLGLDAEFDGGCLFGELLIGDEVLPLDEPARWHSSVGRS
jgi:hypothetical protein